jgi:hypothetical protein
VSSTAGRSTVAPVRRAVIVNLDVLRVEPLAQAHADFLRAIHESP